MVQEPIDEERVRAGHTGDGVRQILVISLVLAAIGFGLVATGTIGFS